MKNNNIILGVYWNKARRHPGNWCAGKSSDQSSAGKGCSYSQPYLELWKIQYGGKIDFFFKKARHKNILDVIKSFLLKYPSHFLNMNKKIWIV